MSHRPVRPDGLELHTTRSTRSPSISSDIQSVSGRSIGASPPHANPQPAYIAPAGASQLISNEFGYSVSVSEPALVLINNFLDQLLFSILSSAHSTNLGKLKATVPVILKPRLGKAALEAADEELREYLEESDEEESHAANNGFELKSEFDVELAWKLARLRCMVYTRLGDLEEEDEEDYIEQEQLPSRERGSYQSVSLGPASAIFLTSVLEYLGEQALYYAGQHAQKRSQAGKTQEQSNSQEAVLADNSETLILEEADMSQIGRESPLSRLWRSWRRNMRSPRETLSRPMSPETVSSPAEAPAFSSRKNSIGVPVGTINEEHQSLGQVLGRRSPSQVPLPMTDRDVDEIEVPGLAREIVDKESQRPPMSIPERSNRRPASMLISPADRPDPLESEPRDSLQLTAGVMQRPSTRHTRSYSLPTPAQAPLTPPRDKQAQGLVSNDAAEDGEVDETSKDNDVDKIPKGNEIDGISKDDIRPDEDSRPVTANSDIDRSSAANREHEQLGKVAAAVSAVAGALGLGAVAASHGGAGEDLSISQEQREVDPIKSVGVKFLGPSSDAAPPKNAATGSSITGVGHFDSIHIPVERPPPEKESISPPGDEGSDPEDLALSSADEEPAHSRKHHLAELQRTSEPEKRDFSNQKHAARAGTSFYRDSDEEPHARSDEAHIAPVSMALTHHDPTSGQADTNVFQQPDATDVDQATASIPNRMVDRSVERQDPYGFASTYQSVTIPANVSGPVSGMTGASRIQSPISPMEERATFFDTPSRPGTSGSATIPARISSASQKVTGHVHANSKASEHSMSSSNSSKLLGFDREQQVRPQPSNRGGDVAVVPMNGVRTARSGSTSTAREAQVASPGSPKSNKRHLRLRLGAEEGHTAGSPTDPIDEAKKKSLEVLINSDETLHYTLTPLSARAENFPISSSPVTQTQDRSDFLRNTKTTSEEPARPRTGRSIVQTGLNGLRSNPTQSDSPMPTTPAKRVIPSSKNVFPVPPSSPKSKAMLGGPRDPRVDQSTTRDLADYARSTGPESIAQLPKALSSPTSPAAAAAGIAFASAYSRDVANATRHETPPVTAASASSRDSSNSVANPASRLKFQARDPRPSRHAETSDLIDFIREGPPRAPGDHRIDRNVAPFRRTMDSDDLNGLASERDRNGTSSVASTQNSSVATTSMQESLNSRTGLLDSTNRSNARQTNGSRAVAPAIPRKPAAAQGSVMPKRTRRRILDPYAIEDSDDELDDDLATPKPKTEEESLIDFLRNTAPPPGLTSQPVMTASSSTANSTTVRGEPSNSTLKDRILRKPSSRESTRNGGSARPAVPPPESPPGYNRATNGAREESPHLSQIGTKFDSYRPTQPTHAAHMDRGRHKPRAAIEARDPRTGGDTRDLAAYLISTGPANSSGTTQTPTQQLKEEAGFLKFFSRKKSLKR